MVHLVVTGAQANAAAVAESPLSVNPAASPLFLSPALADAKLSSYWSQGSIVADSYIRSDLNRVLNGGLETYSGGFTSWGTTTVGAGSVVNEETVLHLTGTRAARLFAGGVPGSSAAIHQTVSVRSNSKQRGTVSLRTLAGDTVVKLQIRNLHTGKYLDTTGEWVTAGAYHKSTSATGWATFPLAFRVESRRKCGANVVDLEYRVINETPATTGYLDELRVWPEINLVALLGHNVRPATSIEIRTSTDGWVANDVLAVAMNPRPLHAYAYIAPALTARHVSLKFVGTPAEKLRATEAFFGYAEALAESPVYGWSMQKSLRQTRANDQTLVLGEAPEDGGTFRYEPHSSELEEFEDFVHRGLDGSMSIVIPSTERDEVLVGRIPPTWAYQVSSYAITVTEVRLEPLIVPMFTR